MPKNTPAPEKKPTAILHDMFKFGSRKTHAITREAVLEKLESSEFIEEQLKHVVRAK